MSITLIQFINNVTTALATKDDQALYQILKSQIVFVENFSLEAPASNTVALQTALNIFYRRLYIDIIPKETVKGCSLQVKLPVDRQHEVDIKKFSRLITAALHKAGLTSNSYSPLILNAIEEAKKVALARKKALEPNKRCSAIAKPFLESFLVKEFYLKSIEKNFLIFLSQLPKNRTAARDLFYQYLLELNKAIISRRITWTTEDYLALVSCSSLTRKEIEQWASFRGYITGRTPLHLQREPTIESVAQQLLLFALLELSEQGATEKLVKTLEENPAKYGFDRHDVAEKTDLDHLKSFASKKLEEHMWCFVYSRAVYSLDFIRWLLTAVKEGDYSTAERVQFIEGLLPHYCKMFPEQSINYCFSRSSSFTNGPAPEEVPLILNHISEILDPIRRIFFQKTNEFAAEINKTLSRIAIRALVSLSARFDPTNNCSAKCFTMNAYAVKDILTVIISKWLPADPKTLTIAAKDDELLSQLNRDNIRLAMLHIKAQKCGEPDSENTAKTIRKEFPTPKDMLAAGGTTVDWVELSLPHLKELLVIVSNEFANSSTRESSPNLPAVVVGPTHSKHLEHAQHVVGRVNLAAQFEPLPRALAPYIYQPSYSRSIDNNLPRLLLKLLAKTYQASINQDHATQHYLYLLIQFKVLFNSPFIQAQLPKRRKTKKALPAPCKKRKTKKIEEQEPKKIILPNGVLKILSSFIHFDKEENLRLASSKHRQVNLLLGIFKNAKAALKKPETKLVITFLFQALIFMDLNKFKQLFVKEARHILKQMEFLTTEFIKKAEQISHGANKKESKDDFRKRWEKQWELVREDEVLLPVFLRLRLPISQIINIRKELLKITAQQKALNLDNGSVSKDSEALDSLKAIIDENETFLQLLNKLMPTANFTVFSPPVTSAAPSCGGGAGGQAGVFATEPDLEDFSQVSVDDLVYEPDEYESEVFFDLTAGLNEQNEEGLPTTDDLETDYIVQNIPQPGSTHRSFTVTGSAASSSTASHWNRRPDPRHRAVQIQLQINETKEALSNALTKKIAASKIRAGKGRGSNEIPQLLRQLAECYDAVEYNKVMCQHFS
jgi:hypothetical protein